MSNQMAFDQQNSFASHKKGGHGGYDQDNFDNESNEDHLYKSKFNFDNQREFKSQKTIAMGSNYADTETNQNAKDEEGVSTSEPRNLTLVSDITCNDGNMELRIKGTQLKKESKTIGKNEYTVY